VFWRSLTRNWAKKSVRPWCCAKAGRLTEKRIARVRRHPKLADFKVPRKVLLMDEIPKGATGKLQRIGLAKKLGLTG
jgi:acyl-CoA synthetase (AMP-forming)/AMP-acid ligase II